MRNKSGSPGEVGDGGTGEGVEEARRGTARARIGHEKMLAQMFFFGKEGGEWMMGDVGCQRMPLLHLL